MMKTVPYFRFWCQKVLPLVYDESLSYYEVLCKCVDYINALIKEDSQIIENVDALKLDVEKVEKWIRDFNGKSVYKSVKDYGAFGDGEHDDTEAFQEMLADTENYGFFYIPAGDYIISDTVEVPSNCRIVCDGTIHSTMPSPGGGVHVGLFDLDGVSNVTLSGLDIVGQVVVPITTAERSRNPDWLTAIYIHDSDAVVVDSCRIRLWEGGYCILVEDSRDVTVRDSYIKTYKFTGIALHYVAAPCEHCKITGNSVIDCYSRTISGESGEVPNTYPIKLAGYDVRRPEQYLYPSVDVVCSGNYVENYFGWWEGIDAHGGNNLVITGNIVIGCAKGVTVSDRNDEYANYRLGAVVISDNVIENQKNQSEFYHNASCFCVEVSGGENISVTGNALKYGGYGWRNTEGRRGGVYIAAAKDVLVEGNNISECSTSFFDVSSNANNVVIRGNNCKFTSVSDVLTHAPAIFRALNAPISEGAIFTGYFGDNVLEAAPNKETREVQGSSTVPANGSYFKWAANTLRGTFADSGGIGIFVPAHITPLQIGALKYGHVGDVCMNSAPEEHSPIGWICTATQGDDVSTTPATWAALPNL